MQGEIDNYELEGIIPRTVNSLFDNIESYSEEHEFTVKVSMLEIYMEKIRDLLDIERVNLHIREDKSKAVYIEDLSEYYVSSKKEVLNLMKIGSDNRVTASTNMNEVSSRSHTLFILTLHQKNNKEGSAKTSKLVLVDLAGSEKTSKTGATGLTLEEAKMINKSLTTLGMVINSLTDGKSTHIPYRESKLTRVLQESLGGNSKTCLVITCSPSIFNEAETLSTLRFGNRAKNIKNKPKINKEVTVGELQLVIEQLELKLNIANRKIEKLQDFIKQNNLTPPNLDSNLTIEVKSSLCSNCNNRKNTEDESTTTVSFDHKIISNQLIEEKRINQENETVVVLSSSAILKVNQIYSLALYY